MLDFYSISQEILGELPNTSLWIYDLFTIFLVIIALSILVIPISLIFKKAIGVK